MEGALIQYDFNEERRSRPMCTGEDPQRTEALGDTVISNFQLPKLGENKVLVMVGLTDVAMC